MTTAPAPLVIGVNVNENTGRDPNPHVPFTADEIAEVAASAEAQGATVMHVHARTTTGEADHSAAAYGLIARRVHATSRMLLAPSPANVPGWDVEQRLSNLAPNQADPATAADLLPVEMGCATMDLFDPATGDYASGDRVFINSVETQRSMLSRAPELGLTPYLASFNLSWTRAILAHTAAGRVPSYAPIVFVLGGDEFVAAHPVTLGALDAHLDLLPEDRPGVWMVSAYRGDVLDVAEHAIRRGGHVVVGVGDHHHADKGLPTTPELVATVAELGRSLGRRPATPDEARGLLGVGR